MKLAESGKLGEMRAAWRDGGSKIADSSLRAESSWKAGNERQLHSFA